jgi:hypothetical protein
MGTMIVSLRQAREVADIAAARAEFIRQGGTPQGWLDYLEVLEEAAREFMECGARGERPDWWPQKSP